VALVAAALLPAFAVGAIAVWAAVGSYRQAFDDRLEGTARALASAVATEIDAHVIALSTLAASRGFDPGGDVQSVHRPAREVADALGTRIFVVAPDLGLVLHTSLPPGTPSSEQPPRESGEVARRAFESGRPAVGDLLHGTVTGRAVAPVYVPVVREGRVVQGAMPSHDLIFGEVAGGVSDRVRAVAALCEGAKFAARASESVVGDMWQKWVGLAALAGMNCLMRGAVGDFLAAPGGREAALALLAECRAAAAAAGHPPRPEFVEFAAGLLTREGSTQTASMLRDIEGGGPTKGEHVLGDLAERAERMGVPTPVLRLARCHVAAYEARREREWAAR
jgi:hypothetical protein